MLSLLLGSAVYRKATDLYFERHDGEAVTTDDFVRCMEHASGHDLTQFKRWYSQAGTPELRVSGQYDAAGGKAISLRETIDSPDPGQPEKQPLHIPFTLGLLNSEGREIPSDLRERVRPVRLPGCWNCARPVRAFFLDIPERPIPSLLRGFPHL